MKNETDFEKWWNQQVEWGFPVEITHYVDDRICLTTTAEQNTVFRGYWGFCLEATFDLDGKLLYAGVWE